MHYDNMTLAQLIEVLDLQRHDEGGWFRRIYESQVVVECDDREGGSRPSMTSIHYVLGGDSKVSLLHQNRSDIVHFHQAGCALRYVLLHPDGRLEERFLGPKGLSYLVVPGGVFKACETVGEGWAMIAEAVSPGFDYRDRVLASRSKISAHYPQQLSELSKFLK